MIPSTLVVSRTRFRQNRPLGHPLSLFPPRLPSHRTILTSANLLLDGSIGTVKVSCSVTCLASTSAERSNSGHRFLCNRFGSRLREWRWQSWPAPRPLYGLWDLAKRPDAPVMVTEGEKAADAASRLLPAFVVVTSPG